MFKRVQGDTRPSIDVTLIDDTTGSPVSLVGTAPYPQVRMVIRVAGASTATATVYGTITNAANGQVNFSPSAATFPAAGSYEGEVSVLFGAADPWTAFDVLQFVVRNHF